MEYSVFNIWCVILVDIIYIHSQYFFKMPLMCINTYLSSNLQILLN